MYSTYVCILMYVYLCIYTYVCILMYVYLCMYTYVCMYYVNINLQTVTLLSFISYVRICVCMYVCMYMYVCVYDSKRIVELPNPYTFPGVSSCGYAGGIGPRCIGEILSLVEAAVSQPG